MKALTADSLLPFAIAAILGFLVVATPSDDEGKPAKKLPELRAQLDQLPPS
jgi:hypothetical protein